MENDSNCRLRHFLRLLLLSVCPFCQSVGEQRGSRSIQFRGMRGLIWLSNPFNGETRAAKVVAGPDCLLQHNEELNYGSERST